MGSSIVLKIIKDEQLNSPDSDLKNCFYSEGAVNENMHYMEWDCKNFKPTTEDTAEIYPGSSKNEFEERFEFPFYYYTYRFTWGENSSDLSKNYQQNRDHGDEIENALEPKINYYLKVFGRVMQTNGQKTSKNEVLFSLDISADEEKECMIEWRDFCLFAWLGKYGIDVDSFGILGWSIVFLGMSAGVVGLSLRMHPRPEKDELCEECGEKIPPDSIHCKYCGERIKIKE